MHGTELHWLAPNPNWGEQLAALAAETAWDGLVALANARLSALETVRLDRKRSALLQQAPSGLATKPVRLAVLAASTADHLLPAIRVAGLRRGIWIETYTPDYAQYAQELMDPGSGLHRFRPDTVLFALDAHHLMQGVEVGQGAEEVGRRLESLLDTLAGHWEAARRHFGCHVIQNVPLPVFAPLLGGNEHRLPGSRAAALRRFSAMLRDRADAAGVDLVALDDRAAADGLGSWYDPALWHRAKHEIHPQAAPLYGDLVGRVIAAAQGRSSKCLVLDLDNTLWGGVIGDDGLGGIKLGQGSAIGEAYLAFQHYARDLGRRGVILAVCSKNDEANALEPFTSHPEMVLKRDDIACFVANWTDKAANIREIAQRLNIGLDSLVFADDNPAERAIIRRELPMVQVPELPEDPTHYGACIAEAGYFEGLRVTAEDLARAGQYQQNLARESLMASATDMEGFLRSLRMEAVWNRFDRVGLARIVQLINKTNQFNLTTRRVNEEQVQALIDDPEALTLQIRLLDQFGDNGIIAIVAGTKEQGTGAIRLDTWLMSCRVLGRGMEEETLNLVAAEAQRLGASSLIGEYRPTAKNGMVREHYAKLGFDKIGE
ncbi:MAG TPA: HAD-IIIC family phosphatase, partial [Acetobacteraceae bacterium]|nr:HAD-IIIC family phosphatase [Acetobacteraceae bacterium]